jgi:transcriptional regulator with XRE-family HTH domain
MSTKKKYGSKEFEKDFGPITFAKLLMSYRLAEELTQDQLGEKLGGLSRGIICDYEKGRRIPTPEKAAEMAISLDQIDSYWVQIAIQDYLRQHQLNYKVKLA